MTEPETALDRQVGGSHYKTGIQPFEISMANGHDACTHAINKYITRHRRKAPAKGYEDCKKAHHIAGIRVETLDAFGRTRTMGISQINVQDYVKSNELCRADAAVIFQIEAWHERANVDNAKWYEHTCRLIRETAEQAYPDLYNKKDFI